MTLLSRALDDFIADMGRRSCSARSQDDYFRTIYRVFVGLPQDPGVSDLTPEALRRCLDT